MRQTWLPMRGRGRMWIGMALVGMGGLGLAGAGLGQGLEAGSGNVPYVLTEVGAQGKPEAREWNRAEAGALRPVPLPGTSARFLWDREHLYFYLRRPAATATTLALWIRPSERHPGYYRVELGPDGVRSDRFFTRPGDAGVERHGVDGEFPGATCSGRGAGRPRARSGRWLLLRAVRRAPPGPRLASRRRRRMPGWGFGCR